MRYYFILFCYLVTVIVSSCTSNGEVVVKAAPLDVIIVDSVFFETGNDFVRIKAYNDSSYLGNNAQKDKLYLFDQHGKVKKIIDEKGEGPLEYKEILNYGLSPTDDIVVYDGGKALTFFNNSDEIKTCPTDLDSVLAQLNTSRLFVGKNGQFYFASTSREDPSYKEYFQTVHTFTKMEPSCAYQNMGGYPNESMFRDKVYITGYDQRIWVTPDEQKVYQLFRLEKKIYVFDGNTNGLIQTIPIEPDYFADIIYKAELIPPGI